VGKIFMSCGHQCFVRPNSGWPVVLRAEGFDIETGEPCKETYHGTYCWECYKTLVCDYPEDMILSEWEEEEYFNG